MSIIGNSINKKGLFYKVHQWWGTTEYFTLIHTGTVGLCEWFWKGVWMLAVSLIITLVVTAGTLGVLWMVGNFILFLLGGFWEEAFVYTEVTSAEIGLIFLSVAALSIAVAMLVASFEGTIPWMPTYISKYLPEKKVEKGVTRPTKQPSILSQYYKAHKEKYCPMLTLKEDV
jgi:hypothetical protein